MQRSNFEHLVVKFTMIYRNIKEKLEKALSFSPVVLLTGARQTGKSTLMAAIAQERNYSFYTFDSLTTLAAATNDPSGFITGIQKPTILDEVQRIPEIFLPIKHEVDRNRQPGQFALTGSANPLLIPTLGDTLAGRISILELFPLSQGELLGIFDDFIDLAFSDKHPIIAQVSKKELIEKMIIGGYPNVQSIDEEQRDQWFDNYITTVLKREISELAKIEGIVEFPQLLRLLATRAGTILNASELSRASMLVNTTLRRYLALLQTVFLVGFLPSWGVNLSKRLVKSPKVYLVDTGLLSYLLGINHDRLSVDSALIGNLFENFVVMELKKQATWSKRRVTLYYYRTLDGIEVDIVLEDKAGNIVGIEVKASETVTAMDFKGLKHMQETYKDRFLKGIVLYAGSEGVPFGKNLFAWPISSLWAKNTQI